MEKELFNYDEMAEILKVIAHPVRLCIIVNLLKAGESNVTCMQECLNIPQSTLSQHLQRLRSAKLIEGKRKGLEVNYRIADEGVAQLVRALLEMKAQL